MMAHEDLCYVFTYGTLKMGEPNHHWMDEPDNGWQEFIGTGEMVLK